MVARTATSAHGSAQHYHHGVASPAAPAPSAPAQQLELLRARLRASGAPYEARYGDPAYVDALLQALRARAADVARVRARVVAIRAENERRAAVLAASGVVASEGSVAATTTTTTTATANFAGTTNTVGTPGNLTKHHCHSDALAEVDNRATATAKEDKAKSIIFENINDSKNSAETNGKPVRHTEDRTVHMVDASAAEQTGARVCSPASTASLEQRWRCEKSFSGNPTSIGLSHMLEHVDLSATPEKEVSDN